ncbi:MAG: tRNA preQ1(34) S-adenosylmethionine ribosyltransferase-isomerase QueA [Bdellovibrionales bacterium GWA2_49_15]|nr:MAG: tRNA preQ1(34) S-adenosylmethionine ribosyltransferase-isomerase QueA [Bdellovibrionales bacterium GWA2_49_15]HAZ14519.1 tRNA preQ1(34) S-adenosylmethionine ribosyltransferase-isomerase QueA [Bdellovibrionales bacterium]
MNDFLLKSYAYPLPQDLVADRPLAERDQSRLLVYDASLGQSTHTFFHKLSQHLPPQCLLVFNNTKVFPCRLQGKKRSGGKAELFVLSLRPNEEGLYECLIGSNARKDPGDQFIFGTNSGTNSGTRSELLVTIVKRSENETFLVNFDGPDITALLQREGQVPIPPYIRRGVSDGRDREDYQTVYARNLGATAAPTAGLHFTGPGMQALLEHGHEQAFVTLHVGPGTFRPVSAENILEHKMHSENFFIEQQSWRKIVQARATGRPIVAVGTTSLRALESAHGIKDFQADQVYPTKIFLYPGRPIHSIDGLITNFHLPESTLLMLVSALVGREKILALYNQAIEQRYRFFSYGDAMFITGIQHAK